MLALRTLRHWFRRPLTCQDVNRFIIDYLEGTIPNPTRQRFEIHLAQCATCGTYFEQYLQTVELVKEQGTIAPEPPEELVALTLAFLHEHFNDFESR